MTERAIEQIGLAAYEALIREAETTPKPGLVDKRNTGVHRDMDLPLFYLSAAALAPHFPSFVRLGMDSARQPADGALLARLRPLGVAAERAMLRATNGVNTHRGALFILGVLCCCAGRLARRGEALAPGEICREAGKLCANMEAELQDPAADTHGARCYRLYGVTGVRGEAARGFPSLLWYGLPWLMRTDLPEENRLCAALIDLYAHVDDTTVLARAGAEGAAYCKAAAWAFLRARDPGEPAFLAALTDMDADFTERGVSPGGCADLLSAAWFLRAVSAL